MFEIIQKNDPEQTKIVRNFFITPVFYFICSAFGAYLFLQDMSFMSPLCIIYMFIAACLIISCFYIIFRFGLNNNFKDASLTIPQIIIAITWLTVFIYYAGEARGILLPFYLVVLSLGMFRLQVRQIISMALITLTGYALIIMMLFLSTSSGFDFKVEIVNWIILSALLLWFSLAKGYISRFIKSLDTANKE